MPATTTLKNTANLRKRSMFFLYGELFSLTLVALFYVIRFFAAKTGTDFGIEPEIMYSGDTIDIIGGIIGIIYIIILVVSTILSIRYRYFAYKNVYMRDGKELGLLEKPSWIIWGYFIPIMNIRKPYTMIKTLCEGMSLKLNKQFTLKRAIERRWTATLLYWFVNRISTKTVTDTTEQIITSGPIDFLAPMLGIAAISITINTYKKIIALESERHNKTSESSAGV